MPMEYPMRRKDRELGREEALAILQKGEYGFLTTVGADGLPYGVPMSYVVIEGTIYIHSAQEGRKIANLRHEPRVSFTVVGATKPVFGHSFSTLYESAMAFGRIEEVAEAAEKRRVLTALAKKYLPEHVDEAGLAIIERSLSRTAVFALHIELITGKAKRPK